MIGWSKDGRSPPKGRPILTSGSAPVPEAKILLVDDERSILDLVTAYLKPEGYQVYTAMDGPAALKAARSFKPELIARIKAALRRLRPGQALPEQSVLAFPHLRIDTGSRRVSVDDRPIELTSIEFELLRALAEHAGRGLSREQLLAKGWGYEYLGD